MKVLLATLNSKFSHTSLALRYLRGVLESFPAIQCELKEFTINQNLLEILQTIDAGNYDVVCFSTYIWNVELLGQLGRNLRKVSPNLLLLCGGPEVTYDSQGFLQRNPWADGVLKGEGEETLRALAAVNFGEERYSVEGTTWNRKGQLIDNPNRKLIAQLDSVPFPYGSSDDLAHRLVYFESARGCPYRCRYCLSSALDGVRFFSYERVTRDLQYLLDQRVGTVKFVDRTFNAVESHCIPILEYIRDHDNGHTCFHLEISAGVLSDRFVQLVQAFRPGLVQMEIGVQSTCPETLKAIGRPDWTVQIATRVQELQKNGNIHLHLDLIAGLPYENFERFGESFDAVYQMKPDMLQLGFLKLIRGTELRERWEEYGFQWTEEAPYEVLSTQWVSYKEMTQLKKIEHVLEAVYNSGVFIETLSVLQKQGETPFKFYQQLTANLEQQGYFSRPHGLDSLCLMLHTFGLIRGEEPQELYRAMRLDLICRYKPRSHRGTPLEGKEADRGWIHELLHSESLYQGPLAPFRGIPAKQLLKDLYFEILPEESLGEDALYVFDVRNHPAQWLTVIPMNFMETAGKTISMGN